jgi:acyl-CoA synthetase (NDP forming)
MAEPTSAPTPIERMLRPRSVAIAGVSATPGSLGGGVLANLERFGYAGEIHLVHPTRTEIGGRACVRSTEALPDGVDCVVLAIPTAGVLDAVRGCAKRGVGGVIIYSAGFAELGEEGRRRQEELAEIARAAGMAVAGPNCLGHINFVDGISLTFGPAQPRPPKGPGVSVISQSGAMASVMRAALIPRGIDIAYTVSTGNEAVSGVEDFLEHLLEDKSTAAIALLVEQFRQPRRFLDLADRSRAARDSAATHTGALTGDYDVMRTLVARAGVGVVDSMEEFIDLTEMVVRCPPPPDKGAIVFGESGAFKGLMLDVAEAIGLDLPAPEGPSKAVLAALAPGLILPTNPVDLTAQALVNPGLYRTALTPLLQDERYGSVVLALIMSSPQMVRLKADPILETLRDLKPSKPVIFAMLGEDAPVPDDVIEEFRALGVPFFRSPDRAMRALGAFTRLGQARAMAAACPQRAAPSPASPLPAGIVAEHVAKPLLAAAGVNVPAGGFARTLEDATAVAGRIGYPVAIKAQSALLSHKSDAGGVILGLGGDAALAEGWRRLEANIERARPGLKLDGVLVETMARKGLELIVGARVSPDWGPILMVGLGGVLAEALRDVRLLPPGMTRNEIAAEIGKLKGAVLLDGFRGSPAVDVAAAADAISALDRFLAAHPEIVEIDVNPLIVHARGEGATALDALIVVGGGP